MMLNSEIARLKNHIYLIQPYHITMIFRKQALIHDFQKRLIKYLLYQSMTERAFHDVVKANSDTQSAKKKRLF